MTPCEGSAPPVLEPARPPVLTAAITLLTGAVSVWGLVSSAVPDALERTPAAGHDEVWRWLTSLVVQDGGALGRRPT
jgi:hypothetical protein